MTRTSHRGGCLLFWVVIGGLFVLMLFAYLVGNKAG